MVCSFRAFVALAFVISIASGANISTQVVVGALAGYCATVRFLSPPAPHDFLHYCCEPDILDRASGVRQVRRHANRCRA